MGQMLTTFLNYTSNELTRYVDPNERPIYFIRSKDYYPGGGLRAEAKLHWETNMKKLVHYEYITRDLLLPVITKRVTDFNASQKYSQSDIDYLLYKFPEWSETRLFELHDLFQVFETSEDGIIDLQELCLALDNLGDLTPQSERIQILASADDNETGSIDFEEFLAVLYELEIVGDGTHQLKKTFDRIEGDVHFIRLMTTAQQIRSGLL